MVRKTQTPLETRPKHGRLAGKGTEGVSEGCFSLFMFVFGVFILEKFDSFAHDDFQPTGNQ